MDVFDLRRSLVDSYANYIRSFIQIRDERIARRSRKSSIPGCSGPSRSSSSTPRSSPAARSTSSSARACSTPPVATCFASRKPTRTWGQTLHLHRHQEEAIRIARTGVNYVLTTGTGSGKSLAYIIPIVDHVLRQSQRRGISAIVVYPMNALANSQYGELEKFSAARFPRQTRPPSDSPRTPGKKATSKRTRSSPARPTSCSRTT